MKIKKRFLAITVIPGLLFLLYASLIPTSDPTAPVTLA